MKKVLVYVDAENISAEKFDEFCEMLEKEDYSGCVIEGKFYGNHTVLGDIVERCYSKGYEFVNTSFLTTNKKNVTDMKIVVDCVMDVMSEVGDSVERVYIVSQDHDFIPLVYKLKGKNCDVVLPFLDSSLSQKTCADLSKYLTENNFDFIVRQRILESPFAVIKEFAGEFFTEELIEGFVLKKKKKVAASISQILGNAESEAILAIPTVEFCFERVCAVLNVAHSNCLALLDVYTRKVYGLCLPKDEATELVGGY